LGGFLLSHRGKDVTTSLQREKKPHHSLVPSKGKGKGRGNPCERVPSKLFIMLWATIMLEGAIRSAGKHVGDGEAWSEYWAGERKTRVELEELVVTGIETAREGVLLVGRQTREHRSKTAENKRRFAR